LRGRIPETRETGAETAKEEKSQISLVNDYRGVRLEEDIRSQIAGSIRGELLYNEPLSRHTSLKLGGPADLFAVPADLADLRALMAALAASGTPWMAIGGGYNLLVRDGGFRGAVISLKSLDRLQQIDADHLVAEAGVATGGLALFAAERGLAGLEFLIGIPGTVGGALSMNAGAHEGALLDSVESLETIRGGEVTVLQRGNLDYGYRFLSLQAGEIIISATFRLSPGNIIEIEERIGEYLGHRRKSHRVGYPNAGSFFRNPEGTQAWRLIEDAGLSGCRVGGAQVSEEHANFLVNRGGAKAADFIELARIIKERVKETSGITLEEEVRLAGED
jgi:UDP-N-acetylmuramate dehydrogenase